MAQKVYGFSSLEDVRRISRVVKQVERQPRALPRQRQRRYPIGVGGGSSGGGGGDPVVCLAANEKHQIVVIGPPTAGTFDIDVEIGTGEDAVTETLTIDFDATASEVQTEYETHSSISSGDVTVTGGPLPTAAVQVEFTGNLAQTAIALPLADWSSLAGTGSLGVIMSRAATGHAGGEL